MKKVLCVFIALLLLVFIMPQATYASQCDVPHQDSTSIANPPAMAPAHLDVRGSLVTCGQYPDCRCEFIDFFILLRKVFDFIILYLMTPAAVLLFTFGGLLILLSSFNQGWYSWGRSMIMGAAIAMVLILASWLIINIFLHAIGYNGPWSSPFAP